MSVSKIPIVASTLFFAMTLVACRSAHQSLSLKQGAAKNPRVVILSIDALRPEFFDADRYKLPTLQKLAREGHRIARVTTQFPTHTYPMHASLVTGVASAEHGIVSNVRWETALAEKPQWFWNESDFKVSPLWKNAKKAGKKVAILRWPSSSGAQVEWMVPEIFNTPGVRPQADWEYALSRMDPAFAAELARETGVKNIENIGDLDDWTSRALAYVLRETDAEFIFSHWINVDMVQHIKGRESPELMRALASLDQELARVSAMLDPARDQLFVLGDHGMSNVGRKLHPNVWLAEKGWISDGATNKWQVMAHSEGGEAAIYLREGSRIRPENVLKYLSEKCNTPCRVISRVELDQRQALPAAIGALVASPGYAFGGRVTGSALESLGHTEGQHGYLEDSLEMDTSFVAWGKGWKPESVSRAGWDAVSRILRDSSE